MRKIEHLGIAVENIESAIATFSALLGQTPYKTETVDSEHVKTVFFQIGDTKIELLEATAPESAIAKYIAKRGEGIHHIAFDVADLDTELKRLTAEGFTIAVEPKKGADGKRIAFLHPKGTNGVLIELCEDEKSSAN